MTHINSISCGQGAPSLYLIVLAGQGVFPADVVITADTGWENDMLWSTGRRSDARTFFEEVTKPLAAGYGIDAAFVRALDKDENEYIPLEDIDKAFMNIPLYGSEGGQRNQSCTSKWKKAAIRQELRRRGATSATCNLGLTVNESQRVKLNDVAWETLAWPLVFLKPTHRATAIAELNKLQIPYLVTSECDGCPHKDKARWLRMSDETIQKLADYEEIWRNDRWNYDEMYFTSRRIPIDEQIEQWRLEAEQSMNWLDDAPGCSEGGYCFT